MNVDPDILEIARKRRQAKRCVACGAAVGRATLCAGCAVTLRYCPMCEQTYPAKLVTERDHGGRTSMYCPGCHNVARNGPRRTREAWRAAMTARQHPRMPEIIKLYKRGLTYREIAAALGMAKGTLSSLICYARATGRWPERLARGAGRKERGQ